MTVTPPTPVLHRKEWQFMTPAPVASVAGAFIVNDPNDQGNLAMLVTSATVQYLYHHDEDAWVQLPSAALGGTFGAGACGARGRWSRTLTANGGTTSTITLATAINSLCIGRTIRFLSGTAGNVGLERTVTSVLLSPVAGTAVIQLDTPLPNAVANLDTFVVEVGRFFVVNAGAPAAGSFREFDPLTMTWATLTQTGLPTIGTDGKLVSTPSHVSIATGTATSATSTTLSNSIKAWTVNQWANSQIRITGGVGAGQVRTISSNTNNAITVSAAWTTTPDATSTYSIEGNDDYLYFLGNNAVAMYRYSISAATWTTLAPGVARGAAPVAGMSANWVQLTGDPNWASETDIRDGRYIYSFRGTGTLLDRYDIALNAWSAVTAYGPIAETFNAGSGYGCYGRYIFIRKESSAGNPVRYFKYSVRGNMLEPLSTNLYPDGAAVIGDKAWVKELPGSGGAVAWLYSMNNSGSALFRLMLI